MTEAEQIMKRCQAGTRNYEEANNLHAACYGIIGKLLAQRTWVGLTDDEMENTFIQCGGKWNGNYWKIEDADFHPFLRTIEAKLKLKNHVAQKTNS